MVPVSSRDIAHHAEVARGGTGFIIGRCKPLLIQKQDVPLLLSLVADADNYIPGLERPSYSNAQIWCKVRSPASASRDDRLPSQDITRCLQMTWLSAYPGLLVMKWCMKMLRRRVNGLEL